MADQPQALILTSAHCPGMDYESLSIDLFRHYGYTLGQDESAIMPTYLYRALALAVRDRMVALWKDSQQRYHQGRQKHVYYLSLEFLMGRALTNAILNLDLAEAVEQVLLDYGTDLEILAEEEKDAGLGNGGLGRLAACFLDSCATMQLPVMGYGLRYEYGMFLQHIENGHQVEYPDNWLRDGNPWELERAEDTRRIRFEGQCEQYQDTNGTTRVRLVNTHDVLAVPFDTPVPGYQNKTVNTLRLWKASATDEFDLDEFNAGSYPESVEAKNRAEHISMVLYPNDASENGKELRLRQQYFLASASLQDILITWVSANGRDFGSFSASNCFQLNDTHPACAVAELMRLLVDSYGLEWQDAWRITQETMAYTNHTLMPEALERWPTSMFARLLPRLMEIVYEINEHFLDEVAKRWPGDALRQQRMSIIEEGDESYIRMAHLAIVGSFSINGVAELHTKLLKSDLFADFYQLWPQRFNNKTNGVTQRRWLSHCNPSLRELINDAIGTSWLSDLNALTKLKDHVDDAEFRSEWRKVRLGNKRRLADHVERNAGVVFDAHALFDSQVKRIHEYKRQLLNILHVIHLYDRIKQGQVDGLVPRCILIGGKAAPGYAMAKLIIKLINNVAGVVNRDAKMKELLTVAFLPNFRVTAMEIICAGSDLSEQISTAGKEASGTGNMKFMLNGALTIGTLDGANIEIREQVGKENFFLFGLDADGVNEVRGDYQPAELITADDGLHRTMSLLEDGHFSKNEEGIFDPIVDSIRNPNDAWMVAADFRSYADTQEQVSNTYRDQEAWTRMSILNTAASGRFSSDRTIRQYAEEIWGLRVPGAD
ncbi:MAG: glycogen/starch/alpha-glucan phosphorylase [Pseudomonadales bacterium]|nr:glycogen/starch/alpha-glucan phosphorylase [Pseudomonadales bacterium]